MSITLLASFNLLIIMVIHFLSNLADIYPIIFETFAVEIEPKTTIGQRLLNEGSIKKDTFYK